MCLSALVAECVLPGLCEETPDAGGVTGGPTAVNITTRRDGDLSRVIVENSELSEITVTFDFATVNLKSDVTFPYTETFKPGKTEAFVLSPVDTEAPWQYSYTNYYKLGSSDAEADSTVYLLPYAPGKTYRVTQGYNGKFSHTGSNQYAIDWQMPEGTPVFAARGGLVVKVKDDSNQGGSSVKYDRYNNYVLIRHDDGTLGHYCHLKKGGAKVKPGQIVRPGDLIALSGNTGFSSGAHLHFCVFKTLNGRERLSLPVKFENNDRQAITLVEGRRYTAPALGPAEVATSSGRSATPALP